MVIYAFVHVESRYIGAFAVVMWLGLFSGWRMPAQQQSRRLLGATAIALTIVILTVTIFSTVAELRREDDHISDAASQWKRAESLQQMGLRPGDSVGVIGSAQGAARWARLARVQIVAEIPWTKAEEFWFADDVTRLQVIETFADAGVKAIVAEKAPRGVSTTGWQKLGSRSDYAYLFK